MKKIIILATIFAGSTVFYTGLKADENEESGFAQANSFGMRQQTAPAPQAPTETILHAVVNCTSSIDAGSYTPQGFASLGATDPQKIIMNKATIGASPCYIFVKHAKGQPQQAYQASKMLAESALSTLKESPPPAPAPAAATEKKTSDAKEAPAPWIMAEFKVICSKDPFNAATAQQFLQRSKLLTLDGNPSFNVAGRSSNCYAIGTFNPLATAAQSEEAAKQIYFATVNNEETALSNPPPLQPGS